MTTEGSTMSSSVPSARDHLMRLMIVSLQATQPDWYVEPDDDGKVLAIETPFGKFECVIMRTGPGEQREFRRPETIDHLAG